MYLAVENIYKYPMETKGWGKQKEKSTNYLSYIMPWIMIMTRLRAGQDPQKSIQVAW